MFLCFGSGDTLPIMPDAYKFWDCEITGCGEDTLALLICGRRRFPATYMHVLNSLDPKFHLFCCCTGVNRKWSRSHAPQGKMKVKVKL